MSVIKSRGREARESANQNNISLKDVQLKLGEGESHKVRLLSVEDSVEYEARGDFENGIYTQPTADDSPLAVAHKEGGEQFDALYPQKRFLFIFGSLETGKLVALTVSKNQASGLFSDMDEYEEVIDEIGFNLKRSGKKQSTVYSLNPIIKMKPKEKEVFDSLEGTEIEEDIYDKLLKPNDDKFVTKLLADAGFDVATHLPHIDISDEEEEDNTDSKPVDIEDSEENPLEEI